MTLLLSLTCIAYGIVTTDQTSLACACAPQGRTWNRQTVLHTAPARLTWTSDLPRSRYLSPNSPSKTRCDGATPKCSTCTTYHEDCIYSTALDGRKPASKEYVKALQQRITLLEQALEEQTAAIHRMSVQEGGDEGGEGVRGGGGEPQTGEASQSHRHPVQSPLDDLLSGESPSSQIAAGGRFKIMRRDHILAYGPTSSYVSVEG